VTAAAAVVVVAVCGTWRSHSPKAADMRQHRHRVLVQDQQRG
jgi:hypothetical protein